ncbi:uncharacterized protein LOC117229613 isoform X3 [Megalopta genalis]|uniref:uncharacterized protein LOC117229613 isoform X3 n=1 Tax=Megalopta genalis TaxID=115081 RepID=UPI003FD69C43
MSREMLVYEKYTNLVQRILRVYGLFPHQRGIVIYVPMLMLLGYVYLFCAMVNFSRLHMSNVSAAVATFGAISSLLNAGIKMIRFILRREKLKRAYDTLEILCQGTVMNQPTGSAAFGYLFICYRLACSLFVVNFSAMFLHVIKPLVVFVFWNGAHAYVSPTAYPWPITTTFNYFLHYITEALICFSFPFITSGVDVFFTMCAFRVCSVLRAMAVELEELGKGSCGMENHRLLLRKCIDKHATLIMCRDIIQEVYGPIVLMFTVTNALGMCSMIFEIFQNEVFRDEISFNNWYERSDAQDGKLCVTILSQRLMVLRAYNIIEVTLDLFAKIMNTTISYYFLLATLEEDK